MQCPQCQSPIGPNVGDSAPKICPGCGAALSPERVPRSGSRGSWVLIVVSLLLVGTVTLSVGSTLVALRAGHERDQARENFARSSHAFDDLVATVASSSKLKGPAHEATRKELLQPALTYYQTFVQSHALDPRMLAERASANFHLAGLQVKLGLKEGVATLVQGLGNLQQLSTSDLDPESFPSFQASVLKVASPMDFVLVKGADADYGLSLLVAISSGVSTYKVLSQKHPTMVSFRDDFSALLKASALLEGQVPDRRERSLEAWLKARDVLETLVRDQPANVDFQTRLAESLVSASRAQNAAGETEKAAANLQRAVEVREQMAAAHPDDKSFEQELASVKRNLEKLKPAAPQ